MMPQFLFLVNLTFLHYFIAIINLSTAAKMKAVYPFLKNLFTSEVKEEITKFPPAGNKIFAERDIEYLPLPVRNYIRNCGYIGKPQMTNARIFWKEAFLRRAKNAGWLKLACLQFNSVAEPCRIVYMKSRLAWLFPFEGRDKFQNGNGNMFIKLFYFLTVQNAKSKEMDISALVTTLAETLLIPSQALQPYIEWSSLGTEKAKASIEFGGYKVSGVFEFNEKFEMTRFVTDDRYQSQKDNTNINIRWAGIAENYVEKNGIKFPSLFKAVWYQDDGELEYFKGTIDTISYDIKEF